MYTIIYMYIILILSLPALLQEAVLSVLTGADALDAPDFDSVTYINDVFTDEESLQQLETVTRKLKIKISRLDAEIAKNIRYQVQGNSRQQQVHVLDLD